MHTGITGNIIADHLAKEQTREGKRMSPHHMYLPEKPRLLYVIKRKSSSAAKLGDTSQTRMHFISCHGISRPPSFCLRTSHCRLNSPMKRTGIETSDTLPCGQADQPPQHFLLTLPSSKAANMAHLCIPKNQALGACRRSAPDIQV